MQWLIRARTGLIGRSLLSRGICLVVVLVLTALLPGTGLAAGSTPADSAPQSVRAIAATATHIYGWLKGPALMVATCVGAVGLFRWLVQGAHNPKAHKQGLDTVIGIVVLLFLLYTLDGILALVMSVSEDVNSALKNPAP